MTSKRNAVRFEVLTLAVAAALLRLVPHPPNFAPIGGVALTSGAKLPGWAAYLVPLLAMVATDPILSYLSGYPAFSSGTPVIYASFLVAVFLGRMFLQGKPGPARIGTVAVASSLQFYALTNFSVWFHARDLYAYSASGLLACYVAALPFLGRMVVGDLFYTAVLFTIYHQFEKRTELASQTVRTSR